MSVIAMKMALEALEEIHHGNITPMAEESWNKAIKALRQAIAKAEAEQAQPVVYDSVEKASAFIEARLWDAIDMQAAWPEAKPDPRTWGHLLAYAPQRKPLTEDELIECDRIASIRHSKHMGSIRYQQQSPADEILWHYARAIEAAHDIKEL